MPTDFSFVLSKFSQLKKTKHDQYMATCPAHDDRHPSLSIKIDGNKLLVHCLAGCKTKSVLQAVGLSESDLFIDKNAKKANEVINTTTYPYVDENGELLYYKERYDYSNGKKSFAFFKPNKTKGIDDIRRVPYNLPRILEAKTVYFVEGEKCADILNENGLAATTLDSGSNLKWYNYYNDFFINKEVVIIPDNDRPGYNYTKKILDYLPWAKVLLLTGLKDKEDVYDWLEQGHTIEELCNMHLLSRKKFLEKIETDDSESEEPNEKQSQAQKILELISVCDIQFFHDERNIAYASFVNDDHLEIHSIESKSFELWLKKFYYEECNRIINRESLSSVKDLLIAKAIFEGDEQNLFNRVAFTNDNNTIWYDLSDPKWRAVRITKQGWEIVERPPILFQRYNHQCSQVLPRKNDEDINRIFQFINIKEEQRLLFLVWLISCFWPDIPHPIIIYYGEKGSAKSTASAFAKKIIDPSAIDVLTIPRGFDSLAVILEKHWCIPFDNVSHLSGELSDNLCRAITGGALINRKLYSDNEDIILKFQRVVSLNGINVVAARPDLMDRSILFELIRIKDNKRREINEISKDFSEFLPLFLGRVFDIISQALRIIHQIHLDELFRMADFTKVGFSIAEALGGKGKQFLQDYKTNQNIQNIEIINNSPLAILITDFMKEKNIWSGRVSDLYNLLESQAKGLGINTKSKSFPSASNVLTRRLNELKSNLESVGITFNLKRNSKGSFIILSKKPI